jgi:AcrR family transcriptional regulator
MDAAVDLFAEQGYAQTSVDDICTSIGASRSSFYLHFDTKRNALLSKWREEFPRFIEQYQELDRTPSRAGTVGEMRAWLRRCFDWSVENRSLLLAMQQAIAVEPELVSELGRMADPGCVADALEGYLRAKTKKERERKRLRTTLLAVTTMEVLAFLVLQPTDVDVDEGFDFLSQLWSDALRGGLGKTKKAVAHGSPRAAGPRIRPAAGNDPGRQRRRRQGSPPPISFRSTDVEGRD